MKRIHALLLLATIGLSVASAQELADRNTNNLRIKAAALDDKILLRWSPTNSKAWSDARNYGITLERYLVVSESGLQNPPVKKVLGNAIKAAPVNDWQQIIEKSDYAAVIAQAFYGEEFSLSSSSTPRSMGEIINMADELQQRYSSSVFMAEYDFQAALLAGWAWEDTDVRPNEKYLYRIFLNTPTRTGADTVAVFTGLYEKQELPKPFPLQAFFGDKSVLLSWNYMMLSTEYHSYRIERSDGNENNFKSISDLPVTPLDATSQEIYHTDSLPDNETRYYYRVCGINSFGQQGPWSDVISGQGVQAIDCVPVIISGYFPSINQANIRWELDCEPAALSHISIRQSTTIDGTYQTVVEHLDPELREHTFTLTDETNYLQLVAHAFSGQEKLSLPYMIRQLDSIPPAVPAGLTVRIDSIGIARLYWKANVEPDLRGYRVLRSFSKKEEPSSLTVDFIKENTFTDTLSMKMMNREVFYSVSAADLRFNESKPCATVLALKPDVIPPIEPAFREYRIEGESVKLTWVTDPEDEVDYYLFRKNMNDTVKSILLIKSDYKTRSYTDSPPETSCYEYSVMAIDKSYNISTSPKPVKACVEIAAPVLKISDFNAYVNHIDSYIELTWSKHPKALGYKVYKKTSGSEMQLLKELDASQSKIVDENIYPSNDYEYTIVIMTKPGEKCQPQKITVKY